MKTLTAPPERTCTDCRRTLPAAEFLQHRNTRKSYFRGRCKACHEAYIRPLIVAWKQRNPEKAAEAARVSAKAWAKRNPERVKRNGKAWRANNPHRHKRNRRQEQVRKYGLTLADYEAMKARQQGRCAICKRTQEANLGVDHCHTTGRVRGLLCHDCNRMLGFARDNPQTLATAAKYLKE
jgi:hypothetical protein